MQMLAAVASARNKQLETFLARVTQSNQQLQAVASARNKQLETSLAQVLAAVASVVARNKQLDTSLARVTRSIQYDLHTHVIAWVVAAVASVIQRNKQLETSLAQVQGLHLEGLSPVQRTQLAMSQVQAASRLSHGLGKAEQASISSAMQSFPQLNTPHHHQLPHTPQRATPAVPQTHPHTPHASAIPQPQHELQGNMSTPSNRVSMDQAGGQPAESNVLVEWDLLGPDEGEVDEGEGEGEEDKARGDLSEESQQPAGLS
ncbi:hypothetical protein DUNSADRAFT_8286 [Dunaliella salina]|uniref:Uncharacterized protein n=1 Tax=Dunaliella salina TaxID=3046 RepID=A0ABQ7HA92_DUNSA|nr:hypothetical protein DUNSADRAFT_8286 [Dunaliella salina]|eukprot:KAF5843770.1 hypothetical protein DUNSADRAFT_8286 [Dunaliella salina]